MSKARLLNEYLLEVIMKIVLIILLAMMVCTTANAKEQKKQYELALSQPDEPMFLNVDMRNGSIDIEGYDGKVVEIIAVFTPLSKEQQMDEYKSRKQWERDEARRQARHQPLPTKANNQPKQKRSKEGLKVVNNQLMNLEIKEHNNRVRIVSEHSTFFTTVTLKVPKTASVEVDLYRGGEIAITNISGPVELDAWQANVRAQAISGPIVAETHQSDIEVIFSSFNDQHPTSLTTYSGDIDLTIPAKMAANMNVQNYRGQILSGIDEEFVTSESVKESQDGKSKEIVVGGQMTAKINGGGQDISLITYSGDVYIRQ